MAVISCGRHQRFVSLQDNSKGAATASNTDLSVGPVSRSADLAGCRRFAVLALTAVISLDYRQRATGTTSVNKVSVTVNFGRGRSHFVNWLTPCVQFPSAGGPQDNLRNCGSSTGSNRLAPRAAFFGVLRISVMALGLPLGGHGESPDDSDDTNPALVDYLCGRARPTNGRAMPHSVTLTLSGWGDWSHRRRTPVRRLARDQVRDLCRTPNSWRHDRCPA